MDDKIDFVITWVDGNDKKWQEERNRYTQESKNKDNRETRYRNWDNLKYWFRGVEKYASWVNKIHFVTYGHIPEWLNIDNPKLNIVNHKDFIPNEYLPTFNSNTIELNLHRISNLSDKFVYFNDDVFITKKVKKEDFFKNGMPCDSAILSPIISYDKDGFANIAQNNMKIINSYFDKSESIKKNFTKWFNLKYGTSLFRTICLMPWRHFPGFYDTHITFSYTKDIYSKLWEKEKDILDSTCKCKFRDNSTNVSQWIFRYWLLAEGNFYPRSINFGKKFQYENDNSKMYDAIEKQKYKVICLNDCVGDYDFETEKMKTIKAFEKILPAKSSFEK